MRGRILGYSLNFGLAMPDGEEVVQDVFLTLFQYLSGGGSRDRLCGWLFRVAHNLSLKRRFAIVRRPDDPAEGLRYREISEVLGISLGSVANSLSRSLARMSVVDKRSAECEK